MVFFFLFFLQGTSIGNGQQGISYNVSWLYFSSGKVKNNLSVMPKVYKYTLIFD